MTRPRHKVARAELPGGRGAHFDLGPDRAAAPRGVTITFDDRDDPALLDKLAELLDRILDARRER